MKKTNLQLALALLAAVTPFTLAQDAASSPSTAPNSQTTTSSGQAGAGYDVTANAAATYPTKQETAKNAENDGDLTQQLQSRFSQDPAFANVQVSVTNRTAMIRGSVASKADKKRAKDLAKSIAGVKHVKEQLTVSGSSSPGSGSGSSGSNNNPTNASSTGTTPTGNTAAPSASIASAAPSPSTEAGVGSPTVPGRGPTSVAANNPNGQASAAMGANTSSSTIAAQSPVTAQSPNMGEASASTASATGQNPSSAPQNPSSAAGETNMAGQGPVTSPSAAPPATAAGVGAAAGSATIGVSVNDAATLQSQIQNALQNEPTLKNDTVNVSVSDSTIELSGNVQTGKEKETAHRIASSFAENRRVRDRITVSGRGTASSSPNADTPGSNPMGNRNGNPSNPNNP